MYIKKLKKAAEEFRNGIEKCPISALPFTMITFPKGSCGDASLLLGTYLTEKGFGEFSYICKIFDDGTPNWHSHAWIQKENLFIDITADQFPEEVTEKVLVAYNSTWHQKFNVLELQDKADYRSWCSNTIAMLDGTYKEIVKNIKTS